MNNKEKVFGFVAWFALCMIAMGAAGWATVNGMTWYDTLEKPNWNPPKWIFSPVWITLYLLMSIAIWLVWSQQKPDKTAAIVLFVVQLLLNTLWSFVFFVARNPGAGAVEIVILWMAVLATLAVFFKQSKAAGLLILPYFLWVTFAAVLNVAIWRLN